MASLSRVLPGTVFTNCNIYSGWSQGFCMCIQTSGFWLSVSTLTCSSQKV